MFYLARISQHLEPISHISNFHYEIHNKIATPPKPFRVICACLLNLLSLYILSCTHLAPISQISNFHYEIHNQIVTSPKPFRVIMCMLLNLLGPYILSHTLQIFIMRFTIKLLPL